MALTVKSPSARQRDRAVALLQERGMTRLSEFRQQGVTAATISRLEQEGTIIRLARGLYQLPDATAHAHHALAEAAKLVPRGVVCLVSALAFHDLTDQVPPRVWMAIGRKDWRPCISYPPIQFVRFSVPQLASDVECHTIEGVQVPVFGVVKTLADVFRYRRVVGMGVAVEGLREAIRQRKATPAAIAKSAVEAGVWNTMQPYMEALTTSV